VTGVIIGFGGDYETAADVLFVICCAIGCIPIIQAVYIAYLRKTVDINVLMLVAVAGSLASEDYLDSSLVVTLFLFAETIEDIVLCYVRNSIKLSSGVVPKKAVLLSGKSVPVDTLNIGDIVTIRAGDMIPVDGIIARGQAVVDESALTGIFLYYNLTKYTFLKSKFQR
jgi:Cd2+/Zn2+-exporting ATPase